MLRDAITMIVRMGIPKRHLHKRSGGAVSIESTGGGVPAESMFKTGELAASAAAN